MIIDSILAMIYNFFDSVFDFHIPSWDGLVNIIDFIDELISYGIDIYQFFIPPVGQVLLTLIITAELVTDFYFIIMWILKKIPTVDIH